MIPKLSAPNSVKVMTGATGTKMFTINPAPYAKKITKNMSAFFLCKSSNFNCWMLSVSKVDFPLPPQLINK